MQQGCPSLCNPSASLHGTRPEGMEDVSARRSQPVPYCLMADEPPSSESAGISGSAPPSTEPVVEGTSPQARLSKQDSESPPSKRRRGTDGSTVPTPPASAFPTSVGAPPPPPPPATVSASDPAAAAAATAVSAAQPDVNERHEEGFRRALAKRSDESAKRGAGGDKWGDARDAAGGGTALLPRRSEGLQLPRPLHARADGRVNDLDHLRLVIGKHTWENVHQLIQQNHIKREQQTAYATMFFMWRFYMGYSDPEDATRGNPPHSLVGFDRRLIMCACFFLAAKIEDCPFKLRLGDLAYQAFNETHGTSQNSNRSKQIASAELYLVVSMLGFDFAQKSPTLRLLDELRNLTGLRDDNLLGPNGILWCIAAYRNMWVVCRTPLCVTYSPREIAVGLILLCRAWEHTDVWCTVEGDPVSQPTPESLARWKQHLEEKHGITAERGVRMADELGRELALQRLTPEAINHSAREMRNRQTIRRGLSQSPGIQTPVIGGCRASSVGCSTAEGSRPQTAPRLGASTTPTPSPAPLGMPR